MSLPAGSHLGHFEILSPIGAGGMGVVFAATDRSTNQRVAVNVLTAGIDQGFERFMREANTLARLRHPDIVE